MHTGSKSKPGVSRRADYLVCCFTAGLVLFFSTPRVLLSQDSRGGFYLATEDTEDTEKSSWPFVPFVVKKLWNWFKDKVALGILERFAFLIDFQTFSGLGSYRLDLNFSCERVDASSVAYWFFT